MILLFNILEVFVVVVSFKACTELGGCYHRVCFDLFYKLLISEIVS